MTYSLSSVKKIGDYKQKIITTWSDAPITDNRNVYNKMKAWHLLIDDLNANGWETGARNFQNMQATGTGNGTSNGNYAEIYITFKLKKNAEMLSYPTYIQAKFECDNGIGSLETLVNNYMQDLIGIGIPSAYIYPVNVIINMKNYSV